MDETDGQKRTISRWLDRIEPPSYFLIGDQQVLFPLKKKKKKNSRKIFYPVTNGKRLYYVLNFFRQNYAQLKDFKYPIAQLTWKYLWPLSDSKSKERLAKLVPTLQLLRS